MMKKLTFLFALSVLSVSVGCNQNGATPQDDRKVSGEAAGSAHDHDHAHGETTDHSVEGHAHGVGPHDGTIADWGGGTYHVEFTVDREQQQATVYVLGSDEKTPAPIDAESIELSITDPEMQVTLQAEPQQDDPEGRSSRFVGTDEKLGIVQEYAGTMTGVVEGTPYSGDFEEQPHGEHEH
jgi:hypothetical protein